jgi:hypothetical protein
VPTGGAAEEEGMDHFPSRVVLVLLLAGGGGGCAASHRDRPDEPAASADAGAPADGGAPVSLDTVAPADRLDLPPSVCPPDLVLERGRCVGWRPAAEYPGPSSPTLFRSETGDIVYCDGGRFFRYDLAADRWDVLPEHPGFAGAVVPPTDGVAAPMYGVSQVLGWLPDGTRVLWRRGLYSVDGVATRDERGDGDWQPTQQPVELWPQPVIAWPVAADTIIFAGSPSALWVAVDPIER